MLTLISSCASTSCAFNNSGCTAGAITVDAASNCQTKSGLDLRAGLENAEGRVGACHRVDCAHNTNLMCQSANVELSEAGDCVTYAAR
ncbi:hypothetical protein [Corynebacterium uterequi]|uniref:Putative DUF1540 family protein n=1 Tax=Corynebacterium uterequi TaxID=1072256 RepID=A0A0G3HDP7_9CORY|nr:hypothetical protein [Corynebacterium uterequi]AKK10093.1 putative DUF1540 family protein [Corynebacterium uterequi]